MEQVETNTSSGRLYSNVNRGKIRPCDNNGPRRGLRAANEKAGQSMIIKCPQCSTGYSIPEKMIGEKPRKMRCSRCKNVFTIVRRQETAPSGYEEFTGKQHLPDEFAFLREAENDASPGPPAPPAEAPAPAPPEPAPEPTPSQPAAARGLYKAIVEGSDREPEAIPLEPKVVSGPTRDPSAPPAPPVEPPQQPQPPAAEPAPQPPEQPAPPRPSAPSAVEDIYGGTASAWEMEAPLELGGYAIEEETPSGGQSAGKFFTVLIILVVLFFTFVAYRNGWSISIPDLGDQIAFAFSGQELESLPEEVENIDTTIADRKMLMGKEDAAFLVVSGEVVNGNPMPRTNIMIRGQLIDGAGDVRSEVRAPCGKVIDDPVLEATKKGDVAGHYRQSGSLYNCILSANGSTVFQLVFEDLPADYDSSFAVKARAIGAVVPD